jgi:tRNA wybutosine-synthesizing protein 1
MLPTPEWAEFGSAAAGFSPADTRVKKERRHPGRAAAAAAAAEAGGGGGDAGEERGG